MWRSGLYTIYRFESEETRMNLLFRDHTLSDLIGFVYSGMPPQDAANNLMHKIKESAKSVHRPGKMLWFQSFWTARMRGNTTRNRAREFLRRFYDALQKEPGMEAVTVSEAIARHKNIAPLKSLVPGSWINANFNVWIGAPEDNKAWDYLQSRTQFLCAGRSWVRPRNSASWHLKKS